MEGWIKLHRKLSENPLWTCEPFTRGQAWVDLILIASHEESFFYVRNVKVLVNRGEISWSESKLSVRFGWSRTKLRKFLKDLEKEQQIIIHKSNVIQIITIVNYEEYQKKEPQKDRKKTAERPQEDTYKNVKNNKEDNTMSEKSDNCKVSFEIFRKLFPGTKRDLDVEYRNFIKKNKPEIVDLLLPALQSEIAHKTSLKLQNSFVPEWKNLATWINQKCWTQELPQVIPKINSKEVKDYSYQEAISKCDAYRGLEDRFTFVPETKRWREKQTQIQI